MTDKDLDKELEIIIKNTKSIESLRALYNINKTLEDRKAEKLDELEQKIRALTEEHDKLAQKSSPWALSYSEIIKRRISELIVGDDECSE
jgi:archaellum component FlaC